MSSPTTSANQEHVSPPTTPTSPSIARLPPWDGSQWEPADPNQVGSGWDESDFNIQAYPWSTTPPQPPRASINEMPAGQNQVGSGWDESDYNIQRPDSSTTGPLPPPSTNEHPAWDWTLALPLADACERPSGPGHHAPDTHAETVNMPQYDTVQAAYEALRVNEDPDHDSFLRILYSDYAVEVERGRAALRAQEQLAAGHESDSGDEYVPPPSNEEFPSYMASMQGYLEYNLLVRDCASKREREGRPAAPCSRHQPCDQCRLHHGSRLNVFFWKTLPDDTLDQHVREYLRIRDVLTPSPHDRPAERDFRPRHRSLETEEISHAPAAVDQSSASPGPARIPSPVAPALAGGDVSAAPHRGMQDGNFSGPRTAGSTSPPAAPEGEARVGPNAAELAQWEQLYATHHAAPDTTRTLSGQRAMLRDWPVGVDYGAVVDWGNILRANGGNGRGSVPAAAAAEDNDDADSLPSLLAVSESSPSPSYSE